MKEMVNEMKERLSNVINVIKVVSSENEKLKADNALLVKINERLATVINKDAKLKLALKDIIVTFKQKESEKDGWYAFSSAIESLLKLEKEITGSRSKPEVANELSITANKNIRGNITLTNLHVNSKQVIVEPYGFTLYDILEEIKENLK